MFKKAKVNGENHGTQKKEKKGGIHSCVRLSYNWDGDDAADILVNNAVLTALTLSFIIGLLFTISFEEMARHDTFYALHKSISFRKMVASTIDMSAIKIPDMSDRMGADEFVKWNATCYDDVSKCLLAGKDDPTSWKTVPAEWYSFVYLILPTIDPQLTQSFVAFDNSKQSSFSGATLQLWGSPWGNSAALMRITSFATGLTTCVFIFSILAYNSLMLSGAKHDEEKLKRWWSFHAFPVILSNYMVLFVYMIFGISSIWVVALRYPNYINVEMYVVDQWYVLWIPILLCMLIILSAWLLLNCKETLEIKEEKEEAKKSAMIEKFEEWAALFGEHGLEVETMAKMKNQQVLNEMLKEINVSLKDRLQILVLLQEYKSIGHVIKEYKKRGNMFISKTK